MNYTTAVMLINTKIRAVHVVYEADTEKTKAKRTTFKTLDQDLAVGDLVIVPTAIDHRHGFTVAKVSDVDVEVDFDSSIEVEWVAGKFDSKPFDILLAEEAIYVNLIKKGEHLKRRNDIAANVEALKVDGLKNLAIANMGSVPSTAALEDHTIAGGESTAA